MTRRKSRVDGVAVWVGWHLGELVAVGVPAGLAVTASVWWAAVSVVAGAGWCAHEVRLARRQRQVRSPSDRVRLDHGADSGQADSSQPSHPGCHDDASPADCDVSVPDVSSGVDGTRVGGVG